MGSSCRQRAETPKNSEEEPESWGWPWPLFFQEDPHWRAWGGSSSAEHQAKKGAWGAGARMNCPFSLSSQSRPSHCVLPGPQRS